MRMNSVAGVLLASAFLGMTSAQAALVSYSDAGSWNSAVSSKITVAIPDPSSSFDYFGTGTALATFDGVTFSTDALLSDGNFFNVGPLFSGSPAVLSSQGQTFGVANILITFAHPTTAFSLNFGTYSGSQVTFLLSNGDTSNGASVGNQDYVVPSFFGVTDDPFTSVLVSSPDIALNLNNLVYGVPEPSTWIMLILGFVGIFLLANRQSSKGRASAI